MDFPEREWSPVIREIARHENLAIYVGVAPDLFSQAETAAAIAAVPVEYILARMARRLGDELSNPYIRARRGPLSLPWPFLHRE